MENTKISGMTPKTPGTLNDIIATGKYWIPTYLPNDNNDKNGRVDIGEMLLCLYTNLNAVIQEIKTKIDSGEIGGNTPSGQGQSQESSAAITTLSAQVANLAQRLDALESSSNWPVNYITLRKNGVDIPYALPTNPGASGVEKGLIVIETNSATLPNFYVIVYIPVPVVSGTLVTVSPTVTIYNSNNTANLDLEGGTIGTIALSGTITMSDGNVFTIEGQQTSGTTLPSGATQTANEAIQFTGNNALTATVNANTTVSRVTISCTVSGIVVAKNAERIGGTSVDGEGYIKLSA